RPARAAVDRAIYGARPAHRIARARVRTSNPENRVLAVDRVVGPRRAAVVRRHEMGAWSSDRVARAGARTRRAGYRRRQSRRPLAGPHRAAIGGIDDDSARSDCETAGG